MSRQLILGTAGHIDHGKTALIRALTGTDTDRLPQEKERGITIDIGFAHLDLGDVELGVVDVPGHERFIKNMLAGAAGIDVALLVVAADDSVMPQTREHLAILQLLRVRHGIIALTKADLADDAWIELVEEDVRTVVDGTFLDGAPIIRTSATAGTGLDELKAALADVCGEVRQRDGGDLFRMAVDRSFVVKGLGTVVTGTVWSGRASVGDDVQWLPEGKNLRVRGLQSHGTDVEEVGRGQRAAFNLQGVHHTEIERGHEIATPGVLEASRRLVAELKVLKETPRPLQHRSRVRMHIGTQEVMASVRLLRGSTIEPGGREYATLICAEPVIAMVQQPFVLRWESPLQTIGGGTVVQPVGRRISRRDAPRIQRLDQFLAEDESDRVQAAIYFNGLEAWTDLQLCRDANIDIDSTYNLLAKLESDGRLMRLPVGPRGMLRLHCDCFGELRDRILISMKKLHDASPLETAIPRQRLVAKLEYLNSDAVLGVVDYLVNDGTLTGDENAVSLPEFRPSLSEAQMRLLEQVLAEYKSAGFSPPDAGKLAKSFQVRDDEIRPILELAAVQRELVHVGSGMYLHQERESQLRRCLKEHLKDSDGMTMSEIRSLLDTTRKYALPICEYLDRVGFTRRKGDLRVLA